jgi:hypothetical protein
VTRRGFSLRVYPALGLLTVVIASVFGAGTTSAVAVTPTPAWRIESVPIATGDEYQLRITNVGGAASNGEPITVTDTPPAGVTAYAGTSQEEEWACAPGGPGPGSIGCTTHTYDSRVGAFEQAPSLTVHVEGQPGVPAEGVVKVEGGGAPTVEESTPTLLNPFSPLSFGLADFGSYLADQAGLPDTQAAGHPSSLTTSFDVVSAVNRASGNSENPTRSVQDVKDLVVDLPAGFVGDPQAAQLCPLNEIVTGATSSGCPAASQVGWLSFDGSGNYGGEFISDGRQNIPVYNMVPEHGYPAEFGLVYARLPLLMYASVVGKEAATHVRVSIPGIPASQLVSFQGAVVTFFGDPAAQDGLLSSPVAFFTNPSDCSGKPLETSIHVDSWQTQGARNIDGTPDFFGAGDGWQSDTTTTPAVEGCGVLHFNPTLSLTPDLAQAGAPTGLTANLEVPQISDPSIPGTPDVKNVVVTLPAGMALSPSAANGLDACSPVQIGLENNDTPACPESSKIATVKVKTPLLAEELEGSVYLAQQGNAGPAQGANPFGSLLALYIVVEGSGVVVKLPGKVEANQSTGQLTTTFSEDPQVPFSDFRLHFKSGPGAPLSNPPTCGIYTPESTLSAWSGQTVQSNRSFEITQGENGAQCPSGGAFSPSFTAGTSNNQAAAFSPLSVTFSRQDSEQTLGAVSVTTPPGLLGLIKGVAQCLEAQANVGTCGPESLIGETTAVVGAGPDPYTVKGGQVYLTGPYNGGPFGLSVVVPTTAGPFTLTGNAGFGKEVVRASIRINPSTAQITVLSNPLPSILEGIPLQIRTVNVTINRGGFTFNPSDCAASSVTGTISSTEGAGANVSSPFEAANCAALPFKPSLSISTAGKTSKEDGASLLVKIAAKPGEANVAKTDLQIPLGLPARLPTLNKACLAATFEANPAGCPEGSVIGMATVITPLLSAPLIGPVILVSHGGAAFPDVEIVLQGEGVEIVLDGHTNIKKGITYSNFEAVPDAPFSSFEANLGEGPHSIFTTEHPGQTNLCSPTKTLTSTRKETKKVHGKRKKVTVKVTKTVSATLVVPTKLVGQNGAVLTQNMNVGVSGCPKLKTSKTKTKKTKQRP